MLKPLTAWRSPVSLVPFSGIQFLDTGFNIDEVRRVTRSFLERRDPGQVRADGALHLTFHPLTGDPERDAPVLDRPRPDDDLYEISKVKALEPFRDKWVPVPFLRVKPGRGPLGEELYDAGPTNWARVRVIELPPEQGGHGPSHRLVLAFDTELAARVENRAYLVPSFQDAEDEQQFRLVWRPEDMAWFIATAEAEASGGQDPQKWVDDWLEELFRELKQAQRPGRPLREEDFPHQREHWARYLTFLELVDAVLGDLSVKLLDTVSSERRYAPVNVDLVLDIGNSRTCGILIETFADDPVDLTKCYRLELRDLSRPEQVYTEPFESRVEFSQADFGKEHIARRAGRARSFFWPSLVRIGPEAVRMAGDAEGTEATTGMSSPKRYLWSTEPVNQEWRFQARDYSAANDDPLIARAVRRFINERGDVIRQVEAEEQAGLRRRRPETRQPAVRSRYSRSALFGFMLGEIVCQTLRLINDPAVRAGRKQADVPRRLRQVVISLPPATPLPEQRILRSRCEGAVRLIWDLMGWAQSRPAGLAQPPQVVIRWDEASCTHLVWLYTEITQKFSGQITEFMGLVGRRRPFVEEPRGKPGPEWPSARVASIDIGGGTTDLMITTYYDREARNRAIEPTQNFREGFKIAGDDILAAVIQRLVLPALEAQLAEQGARGARELLNELFGGDWGDMKEQSRQLRRLFVDRVCVPIALAMLHAYEDAEGYTDLAPRRLRFGEFWHVPAERLDEVEAGQLVGPRIAAYVEAPARQAGAAGFRLAGCAFDIDFAKLDLVIRSVMREVLALLAEAVHALDCDVVLVTGRPSRLPTICDMLVELLPVPPDRIVAMHRYRAGNWYPFRARDNARIEDPKTTASVGAMLCVLAESQIQNFTLYSSRLIMRSTARYIGEMERHGQIRDDKLLFRDLDLDAKGGSAGLKATVELHAPLQIGFRQLALERWIATPLYWLDFQSPQVASRMARPFRVTLAPSEHEIEVDDTSSVELRQEAAALKEDFTIVEVRDARGDELKASDVALRLQTMAESSYWLDTGIVPVQ